MRVCLPDHTVEECVGGGTCAACGRSFYAQNDRQAAPTTRMPAQWCRGEDSVSPRMGSRIKPGHDVWSDITARRSALFAFRTKISSSIPLIPSVLFGMHSCQMCKFRNHSPILRPNLVYVILFRDIRAAVCARVTN